VCGVAIDDGIDTGVATTSDETGRHASWGVPAASENSGRVSGGVEVKKGVMPAMFAVGDERVPPRG
jgi:hypothetical protein